MKGQDLLLIVNTSTWREKRKAELHLKNIWCPVPRVTYRIPRSLFQGYYTLVPSINTIFLETVGVPLTSS